MTTETSTLSLTAGIVAAYLENHALPPNEVPGLIQAVYAALGSADSVESPEASPPTPVTKAQARRSITHDALISFEDGKPYKMLKRHLATLGVKRHAIGTPYRHPIGNPSSSSSGDARSSQPAQSIAAG